MRRRGRGKGVIKEFLRITWIAFRKFFFLSFLFFSFLLFVVYPSSLSLLQSNKFIRELVIKWFSPYSVEISKQSVQRQCRVLVPGDSLSNMNNTVVTRTRRHLASLQFPVLRRNFPCKLHLPVFSRTLPLESRKLFPVCQLICHPLCKQYRLQRTSWAENDGG